MTPETLGRAARRHGITDERMGQILARAGVYTRGRHNVRAHRLQLDPAEVDRVMARHRARIELRRAGIELPATAIPPPPGAPALDCAPPPGEHPTPEQFRCVCFANA